MKIKNLRIALIDDHRLYLDSMKSYLEKLDEIKVVDIFISLKEYIQKSNKYDVLLLDLDLNGDSGFDFFEENFSQKVLIMTSHKEIANINLAYKLGAKGYILKTASIEEMLLAIKTVANGSNFFSKEVIVNQKLSKGLTLDTLSQKQIDILRLISKGYSYKEISEELFISHNTVKVHKYNIINKLNLETEDDLKEIFREYFNSNTNKIDSRDRDFTP